MMNRAASQLKITVFRWPVVQVAKRRIRVSLRLKGGARVAGAAVERSVDEAMGVDGACHRPKGGNRPPPVGGTGESSETGGAFLGGRRRSRRVRRLDCPVRCPIRPS